MADLSPAGATAEFLRALLATGIEPHGELTLREGQLERFRIKGDKLGSRNGWAVLHSHPIWAGAFGSWKTGESHTWCGATTKPFTAAQRAEVQRQQRDAQAAREREQVAVHEAARQRAARLLALTHPATNAHPYLQRKCIPAYGVRQLREALVIPARDAQGQLHTLQFIGPDGGKRFLTGGRIAGCYFAIGKPKSRLLLCEGLATAITLHQATGHAVAVAFNCGNLVPVAKALRSKFPGLRLIVCADNDTATPGNPGVSHAIAAARAVDGFIAIPQFSRAAA